MTTKNEAPHEELPAGVEPKLRKATDREVAIAIALQAGVPTLIWGLPGGGKTSFVNTLGQMLGLHVETVIASIREPSDFGGLPYRDMGEVKLSPPSWARRLAKLTKGVLFLDEITCTSPATQSALLRVILDRVVGDLPLPKDVLVIAAANPPEIAAGGWELAPPLLNRFYHVEWEVDPNRWADGMTHGFGLKDIPVLPNDWEKAIPEWRSKVAEFIRLRPNTLMKMPERFGTPEARSFCTPRTWDMTARLCAAARTVHSDFPLMGFLGGAIGAGAAIEFSNWLGQSDLLDPTQLLREPKLYHHIESADQRNAVLEAVVSLAIKNASKEAVRNAALVLFRATTQARSPGQFVNLVQKLHKESSHDILGLIRDPQMRDFFQSNFHLTPKK